MTLCNADFRSIIYRTASLLKVQSSHKDIAWHASSWQETMSTGTGTGDNGRLYCLPDGSQFNADGRVRDGGESVSITRTTVSSRAMGRAECHDLGCHCLNWLLEPVFFQGLGTRRGNGVTAQRYVDQIIRPYVVPFFNSHANSIP